MRCGQATTKWSEKAVFTEVWFNDQVRDIFQWVIASRGATCGGVVELHERPAGLPVRATSGRRFKHVRCAPIVGSAGVRVHLQLCVLCSCVQGTYFTSVNINGSTFNNRCLCSPLRM